MQRAPLHHLWELPDLVSDGIRGHVDTLRDAARNVVAVGWRVDMAVGDAAIVSDIQADALPCEQRRGE